LPCRPPRPTSGGADPLGPSCSGVRVVPGTLHHHVSLEHLPYYLDEYNFRFNRRASSTRGMLFYRLLQQAIGTDPHPLQDLIGG